MASINRVTLIGNLGADPERSSTQSGQAYTKLRLATNENYQDRNGNWQSSTEWHTVKIWGASADRAAQQLRKGSLVYIEGSLKSYEIGDGNSGMGQGGNRTRIWEIKALAWRSLDSKESRNQGDHNQNQGGRPSYNQNQSQSAGGGGFGNSGGGFGNSGGGFGNSGGGFGNNNSGGGFGNSGGGFGNSSGGFGNNNSGGGFGGGNGQAAASSDWSTNNANKSAENSSSSWGASPAADQGQSNSSAWNNSGWGAAPKSADNTGGNGGSNDDPIPF